MLTLATYIYLLRQEKIVIYFKNSGRKILSKYLICKLYFRLINRLLKTLHSSRYELLVHKRHV